jgi:formylglycine-generating enzyme required for sulfatase activity
VDHAFKPGSTVGGFVIEGILGRGGMGTVYQARDPSGAVVALKTIVGEDADDLVFRERFRREATAAVAVVHPGIVRCLGSGEHGRGLWIALELVPGGSLADRLKRGAMPWREAARLGAEIAHALAAVHAVGIVHRDLKPANVLLDASGHAKLTDFGIARNGLASGHSLTRTGELLGTPEFLAPEQVDATKKVDGKADLYSLGITLHALVTGSPPFLGDTFSIVKAHLRTKPPALRTIVDVPAALDELTARLLAKDPANRGASAGAVALELEAIATGAAAPGPGRRHLLAGVSIAGIAAVATVALATRAPRPAVAPPVPVVVRATPPPPAEPAVPAWYASLPGEERPRLPLPPGVRFGKWPGEYVAVVDSSVVLVFVPGGEFLMGEDDSPEPNREPRHRVELSSFFIGKYEVQIGQFRRYVATLTEPLPRVDYGYFNGTPARGKTFSRAQPISRADIRHHPNFRATRLDWEHPYEAGSAPTATEIADDHPVAQLTAVNALAYAAWLGLDLPTEAQWEYAATWDRKQKKSVGRFPWGDDPPGYGRNNLANLIDGSFLATEGGHSAVFPDYEDGVRFASRVGAFPKDRSPSGVYDMLGNVREICRDLYAETFYSRPGTKDPECKDGNTDDVRVLRGGSFGWHGGENGGTLSLTARDPCEFASNVVGFRVAVKVP